jgi:hypothetical protein
LSPTSAKNVVVPVGTGMVAFTTAPSPGAPGKNLPFLTVDAVAPTTVTFKAVAPAGTV